MRIMDTREDAQSPFSDGAGGMSYPWAEFLRLDTERAGSFSLLGMSARGCVGEFFCMGDVDAGLAVGWQPSSLPVTIFAGIVGTAIAGEAGVAGVIGLRGSLPDLLDQGGRLRLRWHVPSTR